MYVICVLLLCLLFHFVWGLTPLAMGRLFGWVSWTICMSSGSFARKCRTGRDARVREMCSAAQLSMPPAPSNLLVFLSGAFRAILSYDMFDVRGSPVTMLLPLSAIFGRTTTFLLVGLLYWQEMVVSTCISWKTNRPSIMVDCFYRQKTIQSLVVWEKELCHLQWACLLNSSIGEIICVNLMLPFYTSSSSDLATLKVNLTSSCQLFLTDCK
jgi:hypothetical protein